MDWLKLYWRHKKATRLQKTRLQTNDRRIWKQDKSRNNPKSLLRWPCSETLMSSLVNEDRNRRTVHGKDHRVFLCNFSRSISRLLQTVMSSLYSFFVFGIPNTSFMHHTKSEINQMPGRRAIRFFFFYFFLMMYIRINMKGRSVNKNNETKNS